MSLSTGDTRVLTLPKNPAAVDTKKLAPDAVHLYATNDGKLAVRYNGKNDTLATENLSSGTLTYLDGQDQALKTTDNVTFRQLLTTDSYIESGNGNFFGPTDNPAVLRAQGSQYAQVRTNSGSAVNVSHSGPVSMTDGSTTTTVTGSAIACATVDTGQGANELYAMDQNVRESDAVTFASVNTGQGANQLWAMNQSVRLSDNVTFNNVTATNQVNTDTIASETSGQGVNINRFHVRVQNSAVQSVAKNEDVLVAFDDTDKIDPDGIMDTTASVEKLNIGNRLGYWLVSARIRFSPGIDQQLLVVWLQFNGSGTSAESQNNETYTSGTGDHYLTVTGIVHAELSTDFVQVRVFQNSAGSFNIGSAGSARYRNTLTAVYLGA